MDSADAGAVVAGFVQVIALINFICY